MMNFVYPQECVLLYICSNLTSALRSCVKVEVAALGSLSLIVLTDSVDVKQH